MDDNLFIDLASTHFLPNGSITGKILWALDKSPVEVQLQLRWFTEGKGTSDQKIESTLKWTTEATSGEEPFEFTLPASPYSFDGKLISLNWELSLNVKKGKAETTLPITVYPREAPIELDVVENESKRKSFSIRSH